MDISAESGVAILLDDKREIVVVAGAFPHTLAINGLSEWEFEFDPEYSMDNYVREDLS